MTRSSEGARTPPLTDEFVAKLAQALANGAHMPVRTVLQAAPTEELRRRPEARFLLAQSHFYAEDFDAAREELWQLPMVAVTALWMARVAAADGDDDTVRESLQLARQDETAVGEIAVVEAQTSLARRRWQQAGDCQTTLEQAATRSDEAAVIRQVLANLLALHERQPELADRIAGLRPWDRFLVADDADGLIAAQRTGEGASFGFELEQQRAREQQEIQAILGNLDPTLPTLLIGTGGGWVIDQLTRASSRQGKRIGQIVVVPDWLDLARVLLMHDWSDAISNGALHFVGAKLEELEAWVRADLRRVPHSFALQPHTLVDVERLSADYSARLARLLVKLRAEADEKVSAVEEYYASDAFAQRWADWSPGKSLRILLQTCRYTTFVSYNTRDLAIAFRAAGHEVEILQEGDEQQQWIGPAFVADRIAAFRPDLLLRINFLRQEDRARLPTGLPFVTWVEDNCPAHASFAVQHRMLPRDYVTGYGKQGFVAWGTPSFKYLTATTPSLAATYEVPALGNREYRYDVGYISHQSATPQAWLERYRRSGAPPEAKRWAEALLARLQESYARGEIIYNAFLQYEPDWPDSFAPRPWPGWVLDVALQVTNRFYRHAVLSWVSEAGHDLALFGSGWEQHPTLSRHAHGPVENGAPLREVCRQTRVNLQLAVSPSMHQRLIDGWLAGAFFLVPRHELHTPWSDLQGSPLDEARLYRAFATQPITTIEELRGEAPELAERFECRAREVDPVRHEPSERQPAQLLLALERQLAQYVQLRIPSVLRVTFDTRDELLRELAFWLPRDRDRERFVARAQADPALRSLTTEFLVERLLRWLSRRVPRDPPTPIPAPLADWSERFASVPTGAWVDGRPQGPWTFRRTDGATLRGSYDQGVPAGIWLEHRSDGSKVRELSMSDGLPSGVLSEWDHEGTLIATSDWDAGRKHGVRHEWWPGGSRKARVEYADSLEHGVHERWHENGTRERHASFRHGALDGCFTAWHANGAKRIEHFFRLGALDNHCREWHEDGTSKNESHFEQGRPDGPYVIWHPNGTKYVQTNYEKGKLHGKYRRWREDGSLIEECDFHQGKLHGPYRQWHANGQLMQECHFENGVGQGRVVFSWANGQQRAESVRSNGQENGPIRCWHPNGTIHLRSDYIAGLREGDWVRYDAQGQKRTQGTYRCGQPTGSWQKWRADGSLRFEAKHREEDLTAECTFFYSGGQVRARLSLLAGRRHGPCRRWSEDGVEKPVVNYQFGRRVADD